MSEYAAYYTETKVSELLVSQLNSINAKKIIDLGVGNGSLLSAAQRRWPDTKLYAADIDTSSFTILKKRFSNLELVNSDGLYIHKCSHFNISSGSIDVAVCNPPYLTISDVDFYRPLLVEAGLSSCTQLKKLTSDIIFLAQNLRLLKSGGELGIILPDSLVSGQDFIKLRKDILNNHQLFGVIQMPSKIFRKTEAKTHIFLLRKNQKTLRSLPLYNTDREMVLSDPVNINIQQASERLDFNYWDWHSQFRKLSSEKLFSIDVDIRRGSITRKACREKNITCFHTSDFPLSEKKVVNFGKNEEFNYVSAEVGDILLARVGSRCIGRVAIVRQGSCVITDCVYRIRLPEAYRESVFNSMGSEIGKDWFKAHAHGVCAQVISKTDLLNFPLMDI